MARAAAFSKIKGENNMAEITLNIYKASNKKEIEKTLVADGYDLMYGTIEDFTEIIDIDKMDNQMEVLKMVIHGFEQLKPLFKDVFPELTDEDLRNTKVKELARTVTQIGHAVIESLGIIQTKN